MQTTIAVMINPSVIVHPALSTIAAAPQRLPLTTTQSPTTLAQVQRIPLTAVHPTPVTTVNPALIHWQNPRFVPITTGGGQARTVFDLPTLAAPNAAPTDGTLFEAPRDGNKRFYLPRYAIAVTPGTGAKGQWVALKSTANGCRLTVHLADATPPALASGNAAVPSPSVRYLISATLQSRAVNWDLTPAASPQSAALTLTLEVADFAGRDLLYTAMTDLSAQAKLIIRRQLDLVLPLMPPPNAWIRSGRMIDTTIAFTFSKDLDANVFAGLHGASGQLPGWSVCAVNWNGRRHTYYQATNQPEQVYFLPDAFKVGRQPTTPRRPELAVTAGGADVASMQMTLSYLAAAVWDPQRIAAAAAELQHMLALAAPPQLALFQATNTTLLLNLPAADPAAGNALTEQKGALIDLAAGVQGSVTMGLAQFRQVYNALFDQRSALLSGEVHVTVGTDIAAIPFVARIAEMTENVLDNDVKLDTQNNELIVTLTNAIESPVHIEALSGAILKDGKPIASAIVAAKPPVPADLKPAAGAQAADSIIVTLGPLPQQVLTQAAPVLGHPIAAGVGAGQQVGGALTSLATLVVDAHCTPQLSFGQVSVTPDPKATWKAIMTDEGAGPITRAVALKFVAAMFPKPAAPPDALMAVQVVFDSGQTVNFDGSQAADAAGFLNQTIKLAAPVEALVLGDGPIDTYKYRVDQITGHGVKQGAWGTDNRDTLFIVPS